VLRELDGDDLEAEATTCDSYIAKIYDAFAILKVLKQQNPISSSPVPQQNAAPLAANSQVQLASGIKLPELKLPQFDGSRPSDYGAFKEQLKTLSKNKLDSKKSRSFNTCIA